MNKKIAKLITDNVNFDVWNKDRHIREVLGYPETNKELKKTLSLDAYCVKIIPIIEGNKNYDIYARILKNDIDEKDTGYAYVIYVNLYKKPCNTILTFNLNLKLDKEVQLSEFDYYIFDRVKYSGNFRYC